MRSIKSKLVAFGLAVFTMALLSGCGGPINRFQSCVKNGDYRDAIACYQEDMEGNLQEEQKAEEFLVVYLNQQMAAYGRGAASWEDISTIMDTIYKIEDELCLLGDKLWAIEDTYSCIAWSKEEYEYAQRCIADGDAYGAANALHSVVEADTEHYEQAQELMVSALQQYEADGLAEWDEVLQKIIDIENTSDPDRYEEYWDQMSQLEKKVIRAFDLGTSVPAAREACNRLLSCYYYSVTNGQPESYLDEESIRTYAAEHYGNESALDWLQLEFTDEIRERYSWVQDAWAGSTVS